MRFARYIVFVVGLMTLPMGVIEAHEQVVCPQDVSARNHFDCPKMREQYIASRNRDSRFVRAVAYGCGIVALGWLTFLRAESVKSNVSLLAGLILLAAVSVSLNKMSTWFVRNALSAARIGDAVGAKLDSVTDGVHILSRDYCGASKALQKVILQMRERFPALAVFEYYDWDNAMAQVIIQRVGVDGLVPTPLTVVVKDGTIARIIVGYLNLDDYAQKLGEALQ